MSQGLPCLNPACDYEFPTTAIHEADALTCPSCGNIFQLGAGSPASPTTAPAVPQARRVEPPQPAAAIPIATPKNVDVELVQPARPAAPSAFTGEPPVATRVAQVDPNHIPEAVVPGRSSVPSEAALAAGTSQAASPPTVQKSTLDTWKLWLIGGVTFSGVIALTIFVVIIIFTPGALGPLTGARGDRYLGELHNMRGSPEKAFRLVVPYAETPRDIWDQNPNFKRRLDAAVALECQMQLEGNQEFDTVWLAVAGTDYGHERPRDSELLKRAIEKLETCFGLNLELDSQPDIRKLDKKRALVLRFVGELNSVRWFGEVYALTDDGFGYWVFAASTSPDLGPQQLARLQKQYGMGFKVETNRGGWRSRPPEMETFVAKESPFRLKAPKRVWSDFTKQSKDEDKNGVLLIVGRDKTRKGISDPNKNLRNAKILGIELKKKTAGLKEAAQAARDYVRVSYQDTDEKGEKKYKLEPLKKDMPEDGVLQTIGSEPGRVMELKLINADGDWKYVMVGVIQRANRIYIIRCESFVEYHQAWRGEFLDILGTFEFYRG